MINAEQQIIVFSIYWAGAFNWTDLCIIIMDFLLPCFTCLSAIVKGVTTENVFLRNFAFWKTVGVTPWGWFVMLIKRLTALLAWRNFTKPALPNSAFLIALALGHARGEKMRFPVNVSKQHGPAAPHGTGNQVWWQGCQGRGHASTASILPGTREGAGQAQAQQLGTVQISGQVCGSEAQADLWWWSQTEAKPRSQSTGQEQVCWQWSVSDSAQWSRGSTTEAGLGWGQAGK